MQDGEKNVAHRQMHMYQEHPTSAGFSTKG